MPRFLALFLLLTTLWAQAQTCRLAGLVHSTVSNSKSPTGYEAVEGAEVSLVGREGSAHTSSLGIFELRDLPPGKYTLVVRKAGFNPVTQPVEVVAGPLPSQVTVALAPAGATGRGLVYVGYRARQEFMNQTTQWFRGRVIAGQDPLSIGSNPPLNPEAPHGLGDNPTTMDGNQLMMLASPPTQTRFQRLGLEPTWLCFNRDGSVLYTSDGNRIEASDTVLHTPLNCQALPGPVTGLRLSPDGAWVLATVIGASPQVCLIDTRTHEIGQVWPLPGQPCEACLSPDGNRIYVALYRSESGQLVCLDRLTGRQLGEATLGACPTGLAQTPDGRWILVANSHAGSLSVVDTASLAVTTVRVGVSPLKVAVSPDGTRALVTNRESDTVTVLEVPSFRALATTPVGALPVAVAFSLDGSQAYVTCSGDGTVSVLEARTGRAIHTTNPMPRACPFGVAVKP